MAFDEHLLFEKEVDAIATHISSVLGIEQSIKIKRQPSVIFRDKLLFQEYKRQGKRAPITNDHFNDCLSDIKWSKDLLYDFQKSEEKWNAIFADGDVNRINTKDKQKIVNTPLLSKAQKENAFEKKKISEQELTDINSMVLEEIF